MVEMPGIKEPDRVRKLLQGSANLEFWETYNTQEVVPFLVTLDSKLAAAMGQVEQVLDTLIQCYEKQLDCLYADEAMNVAVEVKVMEDLLAKDGLAQTLTLEI